LMTGPVALVSYLTSITSHCLAVFTEEPPGPAPTLLLSLAFLGNQQLLVILSVGEAGVPGVDEVAELVGLAVHSTAELQAACIVAQPIYVLTHECRLVHPSFSLSEEPAP